MKRSVIWLVAAVLLAALPAYATPSVDWTHTFAGWGTAHGVCVQQSSDGGYMVVGETSSGDSSPASAVLLVKLDAQGATTWIKTIKGSDGIVASSVQQSADGGYIVAGSGTLTPGWQENAWLIKTDDTGHVVWQSAVSEAMDAVGYSVVGHQGSYYLTAVLPGDDIGLVLFKTDSQGNPLWGARYPIRYKMPYGEASVPLSRTSDGGFIIGTRALLKVDSDGNQQWLKTYTGLTYVLSVQQTPDGGYIATGDAGDMDSIYLLKTTATGDMIWKRTYAPSGYSAGAWVERTSDGGYVVSGTYESGDHIVASILKTTSDGTLAWSDSLFLGVADCVRQTQDGGYIVTGTYHDPTDDKEYLFLTKLMPEQRRQK